MKLITTLTAKPVAPICTYAFMVINQSRPPLQSHIGR